MHLEHKAGDKCFVDFAGQTLQIVNKKTGEITEVEVFAAILAASQLTYVEAVGSQKSGDWKRLAAFPDYFFLRYLRTGTGLPLLLLPANFRYLPGMKSLEILQLLMLFVTGS